MKRHPRHIGIAIMLASAFLTGCVEDNGMCTDGPDNPAGETVDGELQDITLNLGPVENSRLGYEDNALSNEKIHDYWIAFVNYNDNNKVVATADVTLSRPSDADVVNIKVPKGSYYVYAFANLSRATVCRELGINVSRTRVGGTFPTLDEMKATRIMYADGGRKLDSSWDITANIPMTAWMTAQVTSVTNQDFNIGLYRMLAKIEYRFTAVSTRKITINSLAIGSITDCAIPLITNTNTYLGVPNSEFKITSYETAEININPGGTGNQIPAGDKSKTVSGHFYVPESLAGGSGFLLTVGYTRDNGTERFDYATTYDESAITRNSILRIPIVITDYKVTVDPIVGAPIGGYAPEVENIDEYGTSVSYIGATDARFRINIYPVDGGPRLRPSAYTLSFESGADAALFEETPALDTSTGIIRCKLKNLNLTARLKIKITLKTTGQSYIRVVTIKNTKK